MMDIFLIQILVFFCLSVGNIIFGSLPSILGKVVGYFSNSEDAWNRNVKLTTFLLYVGTGIFISDSIVILLPKTNHEFMKLANHSHEKNGNSSDHHNGHHHDSIPIPEFVILCSFFLAYIAQEIIFFALTKLMRTSRVFSDKRVSYCTCAKRHTECSRTFKDAKTDQTLFGIEKKEDETGLIPNAATDEANVVLQAEGGAKSDLLRSSILVQPVPNYGAVTNVTEPPIDNPLPALPSPILLPNERRIAVARNNEARYQNRFLINSILITMALTLQYIFIGIDLGLESERFHQLKYLCIICLQNFILNFSAGSYFAVGNMELFYFSIFIGLLSLVSPAGLIIAMMMKTGVQKFSYQVKGITLAFACGTLLYTIFCGIFRQKKLESVVGLTKFLAVLIGAGVMIGLQYLISTL